MSKFISAIGLLTFCLWAGTAQAHVGAGANCANCHSPVTGRASVDSTTTTNATNDPGITPGLPKFVAHPGDTVNLSFTVTNGGAVGDQYAVAFGGLTSATTDAGILNPSDLLSFTPDTSWTARGSGTGAYATKGPVSWAGNPVTYTYAMKIGDSTPADDYQLRFTATGVDNNMWTQPTDFVLQVASVPEPASIGLIGLSAALLLRRRRPARTA